MSRRPNRPVIAVLAAVSTLAVLAAIGGPAGAADGGNLILGQLNEATNTTYLQMNNPTQIGLQVDVPAATGGVGIVGTGSAGVRGTTTNGVGSGALGVGNEGELGSGTVGVHGLGPDFGTANTYGVEGSHADVGVYGWGDTGVLAQGYDANSIGLVAVPGSTENGLAIDAMGKVKLKESGKITIPAGASQATKFDVRILTGSIVLVTLQQNRAGIWVQAAVPNVAGDKFTVFLNKPVPSNTILAWTVLN